ncbi:enhanced entry protein EnhA [Legionella rubrilucens]|uniref:Enhanced entry protein EnhA n=1 Tax=Legionella rubrilucens TaxID=458 RepID=A0A0W0XR73_9GAMM|nr:enhanced entry protein EnhA [Legionella rubrilucens]
MKKITMALVAFLSAISSHAAPYYGTGLCAYPQYQCIKVTSGQSWEKLFPDEQQRDIVQRINRTYNHLWAGKEIAVPRNLANKTLLDFSPFPLKIKAEGNKQIIVDQDKLAWAAYDADGRLVKWGPISSGRDKCSDSNNSCRTLTGIFYFFSKENEKCRSGVFPIGRGGAKMPYCMYFHKGFAMHGSDDIPGYRASHGCVRMFTRDALWMNHEFVEVSNDKTGFLGTKVTVRPILDSTSGKAQ